MSWLALWSMRAAGSVFMHAVSLPSPRRPQIKTRKQLLPELTEHVKGLHPYDECEVTAVDVTGGSPSYLAWVLDSTKAG